MTHPHPLPEPANSNRRHGLAGFHAPHGPAYTAEQMHTHAAQAVAAERNNADNLRQELQDCKAELDRLRGVQRRLSDRLHAERADAERYRWLRGSNRIPRDADPEGHIVVCSGGGEDVLWGKQLDAAIDAAIRGSEA